MDIINSSLDSLKDKITIVLRRNEEYKQKFLNLENEKTELLKLVNNLENKIKETEKENIALKLNQSLENSNNTSDLKKKINEMVREIDKCVAYLNK